jgi:hypothetical protein
MLPYYVEPEYWVEGYAEGDAKIAGASVSASLTVSAAALRINDVAAAVACDLAAQFSAEIIRLGSASIAANVTFTAEATRIQIAEAQFSAALATSATLWPCIRTARRLRAAPLWPQRSTAFSGLAHPRQLVLYSRQARGSSGSRSLTRRKRGRTSLRRRAFGQTFPTRLKLGRRWPNGDEQL